MFFYILAIIFLSYRLYKTRRPSTLLLIAIAVIGGANYLGYLETLIEPIPIVITIGAFIFALAAIVLSLREAKQAKIDYLKERRENRAHLREIDADPKIIVEYGKNRDKKTIVVNKKFDKTNKNKEETSDREKVIDKSDESSLAKDEESAPYETVEHVKDSEPYANPYHEEENVPYGTKNHSKTE